MDAPMRVVLPPPTPGIDTHNSTLCSSRPRQLLCPILFGVAGKFNLVDSEYIQPGLAIWSNETGIAAFPGELLSY